ncbi:MAG: zinc-binding dehydrogenase [Nitriliruptorales bacterium]
MFAVTATSLNPDDPLEGLTLTEDAPEPDVADGWEVVEVRAASLNHHDVWVLRGVGASQERLPIVLGCDAAGVTADGREVVVHAVIADPSGDETLSDDFSILSDKHQGTFAERVAVPRRNLVDKPAEFSFEEAACLPTAYLTAYRALFTRGRLGPGDRLLIQGAGGGVSTAAIQLATGAGAYVCVTSRSEEKRERALELGAQAALPAGERLPERVDLVLESVGQATWDHSLKSARTGGTVVVVGATSGRSAPTFIPQIFFRQLNVVGSTMGTRDELVSLVRFLEVTGVRPIIDEALPMTEAPKAFARMWEGDLFGKLILTR